MAAVMVAIRFMVPAAAPATPAALRRNFRLRVIIATAMPLDADQSQLARNVVAAAVGLNEAAGDELSFQVGLGPTSDATPAARTAAAPVAAVLFSLSGSIHRWANEAASFLEDNDSELPWHAQSFAIRDC